MEMVVCNLCSADNTLPFMMMRDRLHWLPGSFSLVQCRKCGLVYMNPRPSADELVAYYPEDYSPHDTEPDEARSPIVRLNRRYAIDKRCRMVERFIKPPGRVLDIGCATGTFLDGMRRRGWQPYGVELTTHAAAYARERLGLDVRIGTLHDEPFPAQFFDAVTMWDVLEHVPDPLAELREVRRILKPGGVLVFRIPDASSPERRWFGTYWAGFDSPRHLYVFSPTTVSRLLEKAGFGLLDMRDLSGNHPAWAISMQAWAGERWGPAVGQKVGRWLQSMPLRLLLAPYFYGISAARLGTLLTVAAKRVD